MPIVAVLLLLVGSWQAVAHPRRVRYRCEATAFAKFGTTQLGTETHRGIVAADPNVFPLGTVIRVRGAGRYSGTYVVTDTGSKIIGRHIDLYIPNLARARKFGKKIVRVRVLRWAAANQTPSAKAAAPAHGTSPGRAARNLP